MTYFETIIAEEMPNYGEFIPCEFTEQQNAENPQENS